MKDVFNSRQQDHCLYLDDLFAGQTFSAPSPLSPRTTSPRFACTLDPQPFHLNEYAAAKSIFGGLAASGWHAAALDMRLLVGGSLPIGSGVIRCQGTASTLPKAVRPGDVFNVKTTVLSVTPSKAKPDRGIAKVECES